MGKLIVQIIQRILQVLRQIEHLNILSSCKIYVCAGYCFKLIFQLTHVLFLLCSWPGFVLLIEEVKNAWTCSDSPIPYLIKLIKKLKTSSKARPAVWLVLLRKLADNPSCAVIPAGSGWKVGMHKSFKNIVVYIFKLAELEVLILPKLGDVHNSH